MSRSSSAPRRGQRRSAWQVVRSALVVVGVPLLLLVGTLVGLSAYLVATAELPEELVSEPTVVTDVHGERIGELREHPGREDVRIDDLPRHLIDAVIAAEDASFHTHWGVSARGIARAAWSNVRHGEVREGGSTITQQYVKNLTGERAETFERKIAEAARAMRLEREHSKEEILERYLNSIYFGRGAYGVQAAARAYFDVDAAELTPAQSALLVSVIPAPSAYDPTSDPVGARQRYERVVDALGEHEVLTAEETQTLRDELPEVIAWRPPGDRGRAPHFLAYVEQELSRLLGPELVHRGLEVRTTLDLEVQEAATEAHAAAFAGIDVPVGETRPVGALVAIDPATGGIRAHVGGPVDADDEYDLAVGGPARAGRQAGSTLKPFALAAFLERGGSPDDLVDAPGTVTIPGDAFGLDDDWEVHNLDGAALGRVTLREATWHSSNTAYARLAADLGPDNVLRAVRTAGIDQRGRLRPEPTLVLGSGGVTPLELASAYATLAADGQRRDPIAVLEVIADGELRYRANTDGATAFEPEVAHAVTDVLTGVVRHGSGTAADLGRPVAGKTGTTSSHADAWFVGYTPDLAAVVWMGHRDDSRAMHGAPTGGGLPAQLWAAFMREALDGVPSRDFPTPPRDLRPGDSVGDDPDGPTAAGAPDSGEVGDGL